MTLFIVTVLVVLLGIIASDLHREVFVVQAIPAPQFLADTAQRLVHPTNAGNDYFGTSVSLSPDASSLAIGAPEPNPNLNALVAYYYLAGTPLHYIEQWNQEFSSQSQRRAGQQVAAFKNVIAIIYYSDDIQPSGWSYFYYIFADTNATSPLFSINKEFAAPPSHVNITVPVSFALGENTMVTSYGDIGESIVSYYDMDDSQGTLDGTHPLQNLQPGTDLSLVSYDSSQFSCATSRTQVQINLQDSQGEWQPYNTNSVYQADDYLRAACWGKDFAIGVNAANSSVDVNIGSIGVSFVFRGLQLGDIALGNDILAVTFPNQGLVYIYQNLILKNEPCFVGLCPGNVSTVMSVSIGMSGLTPIIAVGCLPVDQSIDDGSVFILVNPCSLNSTSSGPSLASGASSASSSASSSSSSSSLSSTATSTTSTTTTLQTITSASSASGASSPSSPSSPSSSSAQASTSSSSSPTNPNTCGSKLGTLVTSSDLDWCVDGVWAVPTQGNITSGGEVVIVSQDTIQLSDNLILTSTSRLVIYVDSTDRGPYLIINGTARLDGELIINTTKPINGSVNLIQAANIEGQFADIHVTPTYELKCYANQKTPDYKPTIMALLIQETKKGCGNNKSQTTGIAVGVVLGVVLILVIIAVIAMIYWRRHRPPQRVKVVNTTHSIL